MAVMVVVPMLLWQRWLRWQRWLLWLLRSVKWLLLRLRVGESCGNGTLEDFFSFLLVLWIQFFHTVVFRIGITHIHIRDIPISGSVVQLQRVGRTVLFLLFLDGVIGGDGTQSFSGRLSAPGSGW